MHHTARHLVTFIAAFVSWQLQFTSGCSPKTVLLSYVDELVCVGVWGAVVLRSLHVSDLSQWKTRWTEMGPLPLLGGTGDRLPLNRVLLCASLLPITYKILLVCRSLLSLVCFYCFFPLWLSTATRSTPGGPWQLRNFLPASAFCSVSDIQS